MRRIQSASTAAFLVAAMLVLPASGLAQATDPTGAQYDDPVSQVQIGTGTDTDTDTDTGTGTGTGTDERTGLGERIVDPLPFTGLELGGVALLALGLLAGGAALRRLSGTARG